MAHRAHVKTLNLRAKNTRAVVMRWDGVLTPPPRRRGRARLEFCEKHFHAWLRARIDAPTRAGQSSPLGASGASRVDRARDSVQSWRANKFDCSRACGSAIGSHAKNSCPEK